MKKYIFFTHINMKKYIFLYYFYVLNQIDPQNSISNSQLKE